MRRVSTDEGEDQTSSQDVRRLSGGSVEFGYQVSTYVVRRVSLGEKKYVQDKVSYCSSRRVYGYGLWTPKGNRVGRRVCDVDWSESKTTTVEVLLRTLSR